MLRTPKNLLSTLVPWAAHEHHRNFWVVRFAGAGHLEVLPARFLPGKAEESDSGTPDGAGRQTI